MRNVVIACVLGLAAMSVALDAGMAMAQGQGGGQQGKQKERPRPPPLPRCPDLGIGRYAFLSEVPGQAPLGADEVAVRWDVHNDGSAAYEAAGASAQSVALEFTTAAGSRQLAITTVPTGDNAAAGPVSLAQGGSWAGLIRAQLPPEARGRRLRLHLLYAADGIHQPINDCSIDNNTVSLVRPAP